MVEETKLEYRRTDEGVLVLSGSIEEGMAPELLALLLDELEKGPLTVNLSEVDYLPSVALSSLIAAWHAEGAHAMTLEAETGSISQRVLTVTGLPHEQLDPS